MDQLAEEIERRFHQLEKFDKIFGFLSLKVLLDDSNDEQIRSKCQEMVLLYDEVDYSGFMMELKQLRRLASINDVINKEMNCLDLLRWLVKWEWMETVPNLCICLRIFLTVCVSVASCERSFSKLKLIKTYLRSTMGQNRLSNLAILSIEREKASAINFESTLKSFASVKARKISFQ